MRFIFLQTVKCSEHNDRTPHGVSAITKGIWQGRLQKKALPKLPPDSVLWLALDKVNEERRNAGHGVRPPAQRFLAFEEFTKDLEAVVTGLRELLAHLEKEVDHV